MCALMWMQTFYTLLWNSPVLLNYSPSDAASLSHQAPLKRIDCPLSQTNTDFPAVLLWQTASETTHNPILSHRHHKWHLPLPPTTTTLVPLQASVPLLPHQGLRVRATSREYAPASSLPPWICLMRLLSGRRHTSRDRKKLAPWLFSRTHPIYL